MPAARMVPLLHLIPPPEPLRVAMDDHEMDELCASIKSIGLIYPLVVVGVWGDGAGTWRYAPDGQLGDTPAAPDRYEIVDGHRRYVAHERLKLDQVEIRVFDSLEEAKYAIMLHANVCREDVTPFEEGVQFLELATKYSWSMDDLQRFFHQSEDYINDRVDVVRRDQAVAEAVRDRQINLGQAKEVLKAATPAERAMLLDQAAVHGATIKALREMRHNFQREAQAAQGLLPANTPAWVEPETIISSEACCWCGQDVNAYQLVTIKVHNYELQDLRAVLDKFSRASLLKQLEAAK